jgi:arabinofuranosyltransferase
VGPGTCLAEGTAPKPAQRFNGALVTSVVRPVMPPRETLARRRRNCVPPAQERSIQAFPSDDDQPVASAPRSREPALIVALILVAGSLFAWQLRSVGDLHIDDAYISFSFSKNLATGQGLVYSHGLRVEGYSNFLWVTLVAAGLRLAPAASPVLLARAIDMAFLGLLGASVYLLARRRAPPWLAAASVVLVAANADLAAAHLSGLETVSFTALLVAGFAMSLRRDRPGARRLALLPFVAAALTRIDGMIPLAFVLGCELLLSLIERRFSPWRYLRWAGPPVALYLAWFAWRWWYYGAPLPSTYYAKDAIAVALPARGREYVEETLRAWGAVFLVPPAIVAAIRGGREARLLLAFVLGHLAYVIKVGGDWMPFGRFVLPVAPLMAVLAAWGVAKAVDWTRRRWQGWLVGAAGLALLAAAGTCLDRHSTNTDAERSKLAATAGQIPYHDDNLFPGSALMGHVVRPGERLVSDYTGVFAYFTDAAVIDMWGLANMTIARRGTSAGVNPIFGKTCPACYRELDPDYFHINVPMIRPFDAFKDQAAVIGAVWQSDTIGRHLDLKRDFAVGRVIRLDDKRGLFFLERRRAGKSFEPRYPVAGVVIDYPFEPRGRAPELTAHKS